MKKITFSLLLFTLSVISSTLFAQECTNGNGPSVCTPLGGPQSGGFEDPNSTPCITQGVAYDHSIQFTMFSTFTYLGVQNVDSIQFDSIQNLPCGLCWAVNKASKTFAANEDGCIRITGTSTDAAGQYKLALTLKAWINHSPTGLVIPASTVDQTGIKVLLRVQTPTGSCAAADTSSSANNLTASTNCPTTGITEIEQNISSLNIIPNPMNSDGVLSFVSEKNGNYTIRVSDVTGKIISSKDVEVKQGANNFAVERNNLSPGIYFLTLSAGKEIITRRFSVTE